MTNPQQTRQDKIDKINKTMGSVELDREEFEVRVTRIGDVFDRMEKNMMAKERESFSASLSKNCNMAFRRDDVSKLRTEKRKLIEEQSDECIDFIYSLIEGTDKT